MKILVDTDIYYLTRNHLHNTGQAKDIMAKLYELFYILDITPNDCREALSSGVKDYEDAVVASCAARNRMDYIVTRNIRDYEYSKTKMRNKMLCCQLVFNHALRSSSLHPSVNTHCPPACPLP